MRLFGIFKGKPAEEPAALTPEPGQTMATFAGLGMH